MTLNDLLYKGFYDFICKGETSLKEEKIKVIFNNPATILFVGDKKFVVKAHQENFDEEKGLCMALLRYFGISYLDLKRILATAKKEEKKVEENKNQVKVKKETIKKENTIVSPKGRHRGKPFSFQIGDKVVVRDCNYYNYITNATAKKCLNQVFEITEDKSDFSGSMYTVNGYEFSGSELEPISQY